MILADRTHFHASGIGPSRNAQPQIERARAAHKLARELYTRAQVLAPSGFKVDECGDRDGLPVFVLWHLDGRDVDVTAAADQLQAALSGQAHVLRIQDADGFECELDWTFD